MEPEGLNIFVPQMGNPDTKKRLQLGADILAYLENPDNSIECEEFAYFLDTIVSWLQSSNYKVSQNGLEILGYLADRVREGFKPYISTVLAATVDRMGDSKDQVRDQARIFLLKLMDPVSSPQYMFDKLLPAFNHKNWRVKEAMLLLLQDALSRHTSESFMVSKFIPAVVKLLGDPNSQVRDAAFSTLVEFYRHVGERLRHDLTRKYPLPPGKLESLLLKFDEIKNTDNFMPSANKDPGNRDEVDSRLQMGRGGGGSKRASSAPPTRRQVFTSSRPPPSSSSQAGAADEEMFMRSFEDVPKVQVFTTKDLEQELQKAKEVLSDPSTHWEKRMEMLRRIRSLLVAGAAEFDELYSYLRLLEHSFQLSVKDLRSQVVREACITIAFLSYQLGPRLDRFAENLLTPLINLIPNSAKIMSTAGIVAIRFIIQHTHVSRLIPIICYNLSSKSRDIRKTVSEFLDQLLHTWPTHIIEKHVNLIQDAIKKGISDADPEARAFSRKAFWGFADHFKEQADILLFSLDSSKQRMLQGELSMSNSSSNNSLHNDGKPLRHPMSSHGGSVENLHRGSGHLKPRSGIPILSGAKAETACSVPFTPRSNSAIDLAAVGRARARAGVFSTAAHLTRGSGASLPRPMTRKVHESAGSAVTSPERARGRTKGVSHSQPSSRSGSPPSRLNYAVYHASQPDGSQSGRLRRKSGIPMATGSSRETSPSRLSNAVLERRFSGSPRKPLTGAGERFTSPTVTPNAPILAEKILMQSREAELAVADALFTKCLLDKNGVQRVSNRRRYNAFDDQSDESETSSVCSERSFSSYGRTSEDVSEILHSLASIHWSDRKEGLLSLQALFHSNRTLTLVELKRVTEIFTKMLMDPHSKVFPLFLDTLNELITVHKADLYNWLYVLLTRLFLKMGSDILGSVQSRLQKTLDLVRDSFPCDDQLNCIFRFVNDQTQTPNPKVKTTLLQYLTSLLMTMDPSEFSSASNETKLAITKIISWTSDPKCSDLKKHAQDVIIALFHLNSPEFSSLLGQLPTTYRDNAFKVVGSERRRRSSNDSLSSLGIKSPPSPIMNHLQSPNLNYPRRAMLNTSHNRSFDFDDTENLNPEEIYNSLKKTSAEIQKYNFDCVDSDLAAKEGRFKLEKEMRDSTSQDSGISQSSVPDGKLDILEERLELFSSSESSPTKRLSPDYNPAFYKEQTSMNGYDRQALTEAVVDFENEFRDGRPFSFRNIVSELNNHNTR